MPTSALATALRVSFLLFILIIPKEGYSEGTTTFSLLYAPDGGLTGDPNIYSMRFSFPGNHESLERSDRLPDPNRQIFIKNLPASTSAQLTIDLYRDKILTQYRTHSCHSVQPIDLTPQSYATAEIECLSLKTGETSAQPLKAFIKLATDEGLESPLASLEKKDWSKPLALGHISPQGQRISLRQDEHHGLTLHIAPELTYYAAPLENAQSTHLESLIRDGRGITLNAIGGNRLNSNAAVSTLTLDGTPVAVEENGQLFFSVPIRVVAADGSLNLRAALLEEPVSQEFTVVSYNVENLFDQKDDERNSGYGQYRLRPNSQGKSSNYGDGVVLNGTRVSFTDVKISGIRKVLTAIDPDGPEVVALQEIESKDALAALFHNLSDLGYVSYQFTDWGHGQPNAIGAGIISKFPITDWELVEARRPQSKALEAIGKEPLRRSLKVTLDVFGQELVVYNNHWKSKASRESERKLQAEGIKDDIEKILARDPSADYIILGDLNSEYNEKAIISPEHNDTGGLTGINDVLKAQGDELTVARREGDLHYNLHYELTSDRRRTAFHKGFGWSSFDNMIIGSNLYDNHGISYVDNSFEVARACMPRLNFLFYADGTTHRWHSSYYKRNFTRHSVGGYSDHLPIFARFHIRRLQSSDAIRLFKPSLPN